MAVYLDYAATTPVDPKVNEAIFEWQRDNFGNPSSPHQFGQQARVKLEETRDLLAESLQCKNKELVFTSGGTESNNTALIGTALARPEVKGHLIVSAIEHPSVLGAANYLSAHGFEIDYVYPSKNGMIQLADISRLVRDDTFLIAVMFVNNETGVINPVEDIGQFCREKGITFFCDAIQAFGKMEIPTARIPVDLLSISGHKIYAPKGIGALYIREGLPLNPIHFGGSQEARRRAGTENMPGIAGLGKAVELLNQSKIETEKITTLKQLFEREVKRFWPEAVIAGEAAPRSAYISNVAFPGINNDALLMNLDMLQIAVSVGSACSSGSIRQSHVLKAMNLSDALINGAIRFSFGRFTTEEEINFTVHKLEQVLNRFKK